MWAPTPPEESVYKQIMQCYNASKLFAPRAFLTICWLLHRKWNIDSTLISISVWRNENIDFFFFFIHSRSRSWITWRRYKSALKTTFKPKESLKTYFKIFYTIASKQLSVKRLRKDETGKWKLVDKVLSKIVINNKASDWVSKHSHL